MVVWLQVQLLDSVCQLQSLKTVQSLFWSQMDLEKIRMEVRFVIRNRCFYNPFAFVVSELILKNIMYRPLFLVKGKTVF